MIHDWENSEPAPYEGEAPDEVKPAWPPDGPTDPRDLAVTSEIDTLLRWLEIYATENPDWAPLDLDQLVQLRADIDHSALLQRLLSGKEPLPHPPPLSYSYPDYELVETGRGIPHEVWEAESHPGYLFIDQDRWIIKERGHEKWWVEHPSNPEVVWFVALRETLSDGHKTWILERLGEQVELGS